MTSHPAPGSPVIKAGDELSAADVHAIWRIRDLVFAVEQQCTEPDPDELDLLPTTTHLWFADDRGPTSYLRAYPDANGVRHLGRVATRRDARGHGLSSRLITLAHERWHGAEFALGAQAYLERWYGGFGYERCGENYMEAGIEHLPMRRPPG